MRRSVVALYSATDGEFVETIPYVYVNEKWTHLNPYVYSNNAWQPIGQAGTLMIPFITSNNLDFYTSDPKPFMVRKHM